MPTRPSGDRQIKSILLQGRTWPRITDIYKQRHRIKIMFGRLKDWRRVATRYDRSAHTFFAAITLAATVTFWLNQ